MEMLGENPKLLGENPVFVGENKFAAKLLGLVT